MTALPRRVWAVLLVTLAVLAWAGWPRPTVSPAALAPLTSVIQLDTFAPPHRARVHLERRAPPQDALVLSLQLTNTGRASTTFVVGVCDFRYAVVRVRTREVVWQTDPELGCLLAGLGHRVPPGRTRAVAGTVLPLGRPYSPSLPGGSYVAFASLATPGGVIVAEPLTFQVTRRGEVVIP